MKSEYRDKVKEVLGSHSTVPSRLLQPSSSPPDVNDSSASLKRASRRASSACGHTLGVELEGEDNENVTKAAMAKSVAPHAGKEWRCRKGVAKLARNSDGHSVSNCRTFEAGGGHTGNKPPCSGNAADMPSAGSDRRALQRRRRSGLAPMINIFKKEN